MIMLWVSKSYHLKRWEWSACNFSPTISTLYYGHKKKGNDYQLQRLLILEKILVVLRKCMENIIENLQIDAKMLRLKKET